MCADKLNSSPNTVVRNVCLQCTRAFKITKNTRNFFLCYLYTYVGILTIFKREILSRGDDKVLWDISSIFYHKNLVFDNIFIITFRTCHVGHILGKLCI